MIANTTGDDGAERGQRFVLRLPAQTGYLAVVRELIAAATREHAFPPHDVAKVVMAVDEACVNVVEHAYADAGSDALPLEVVVSVDPHCLDVTIVDQASTEFSPLDHPLPDLEHLWESGERGGLGVLILRQFMDHVSHSYQPGRGNSLRLVKYVSSAQHPSPV